MLHYHHYDDSYSKMSNSESHFNVSLIVWDKITRLYTDNNFWSEESQGNQTEVLLLTTLMPHCQAKLAHVIFCFCIDLKM